MVDRGDDVVCRNITAVMEGNALAQVEGPDRGVIRCFPAFRQVGANAAIGRDQGQVRVHAVQHRRDEAVVSRTRIEGVRGVAMTLADLEVSALLRHFGEGFARRESGGSAKRTNGGRARQEITAVDSVGRIEAA